MKYYVYYRVSTKSQVEANGIDMQKDVIGKYVTANGIEVEAEFSDEGISGAVVEREGITELLAVLERGDRIIVQNTSRLWRSEFATAILKQQIKSIGADVISVEQPRYTVLENDPNEMFMNSIFELLDRYDKMLISVKLAKGRKAKAKKGGKPCGVMPYGYKWDNAEVVIDYNNNLIVGDIFEKYCELKSLGKLKAYCDEQGYRTSRGGEFGKQALKNIIENDFYLGIVTYAGKKVDGTHPAIIDKELFNKANAILKR